EHPGEVPVAGETTLAFLRSMIDEDLGPGAIVEILRLGLDRGVVLHSQRGLGTRLEATSDAPLAQRMSRATNLTAERWTRIFEALRYEARGDRRLRLEIEPLRVIAHDAQERFVLEV